MTLARTQPLVVVPVTSTLSAWTSFSMLINGVPKKALGFCLRTTYVTPLRRNLLDNMIALVPLFGHILGRTAVFCLPSTESDGIGSIIMTGGVKGRQMFLSRFTEKLADPMNALPTFFATAITEALYGLENRFRFIADKVVIYVDD